MELLLLNSNLTDVFAFKICRHASNTIPPEPLFRIRVLIIKNYTYLFLTGSKSI